MFLAAEMYPLKTDLLNAYCVPGDRYNGDKGRHSLCCHTLTRVYQLESLMFQVK